MAPLTFNENALAKLTQNIEHRLEDGPPKKDKNPSRVERMKESKSSGDVPSAVKAPPQDAGPRGKKRSRDGQEKATAPAGDALDLAEDVRALGGNDDDLALIQDLESESECEGPMKATQSEKLARDLRSFVKGLGLRDNAPSDDEDGEVPEEQEAHQSNGNIVPQVKASLAQQRGAPQASKSKGRLLFEPQAEWYIRSVPAMSEADQTSKTFSPQALERLHDYAKELLEEENQLYAAKNKSSSSNQFYSTIMSSGTLSDKISALTLSVQESPLHNTAALDQLVKLARKRSRSQAVDVLGALKDLFAAGSLLPPDRRLTVFVAQPALLSMDLQSWNKDKTLPRPLQKTHLIYWAFEDWLKATYFEVIKIIEVWCNDQVVFARAKAVDYVFELLRDKPEQEVNLLRLLVNKLGDTEKKIASKASYNLLQLQKPHPKMKDVIISNIESDVLFRPNQSMHAKYYAVITLNQTVLSSGEEDTVRRLLDIYFTLFLGLLKAPEPEPEETPRYNKKGERQGGGGKAGRMAQKKAAAAERSTATIEQLKERMISAILTGINRAHPFTSSNEDLFEKHMDTLFKVTHSANFNTSVQALMLIQQLATLGSVDRFYRTLYESLLDPRLLTTSKHTLYMNLLFRAVKDDSDLKRVKAFAKRMLQVATTHQPPVVCAMLYMLRELEKASPSVRSLIDQPEDAPEDAAAAAARAYDPRKRDPRHSHADAACLWELPPFDAHFHPSAALFAARLLDRADMPPKPDLAQHSLASFLDHFVKQNPKRAPAGARGASLMQPLPGARDARNLFVPGGERVGGTAFASENFWKKAAEKVDPAEAFFHKYYSIKGRGKEAAGRKKQKKTDRRPGEDSDEDDVEEEEIWKALVDSRPEIEGDASEDDVDVEDLEDAMADDDEGDFEADRADDGDLDLDENESDVLGENDEVPEAAAEKAAEELGKGRKKARRKKLRQLPMFASVDDYADMLKDEE